MFTHLLIPWFKLQPWPIPFPIVGELAIQPFGLLVLTGILCGLGVAMWHGERNGVPREYVADFIAYTTVIGLIASYLLNAAVYEPENLVAIAHDPSQLFKKYLGLSSYGGFIGGIAAAVWFRQRKKMSILVLGDIWCFAFPFAWLFGRTGCFVVHDHMGKVSDFFLAVDDYNRRGAPRHDLGLYEALWSAAVIALFLWLGRKRRPRGFYMALLTLLYAPVRFGLDFLRAAPEFGGDTRYWGLTPAQYASVLFTLVGLVVLRRVLRGGATPLMIDGSDPPPVGAAAANAAAAASAAGTGATTGTEETRRPSPEPD